MSPYFIEIVDNEYDADTVIYIGGSNLLVEWNLFTLDAKGWGYWGNFVKKDDKIEDKPYGGLVGSFGKDNKHYILIHGNDIDGFIAAAKEFVDGKESYLNIEDAVLIDKNNIDALAVYDYLHAPGNADHYKKNNENFRNIVKRALNDEIFNLAEINVTINGSVYRLKEITSSNTNNLKEYRDPDNYPIVMGGGLWSDITAWDELGFELANEGKNVYLIELTGGPYTERESDYDYPYEFLTDYVFPAYVDEVKTLSGRNKIKYVGHSNGARVALDSLTEAEVDPSDVDTLVLVGVPWAFSDLSYFAKIVNKSGNEAIQRMRDKNLYHVTFSRVAHELDSGVGELISFIKLIFGDDHKISLNLFDKYYLWIHNTHDAQPGKGLNINYLTLIYGTDGLGNSKGDDSIVAVNDEKAIFGNIQSSDKVLKEVKHKHSGMQENDEIQSYIKDSLNKKIY